MAKGVAAPDEELAEALFQQACYDLLNGERCLAGRTKGARALATAQFQQCCEKVLKALVMGEVGRVEYGERVKPSHQVWTEDLKRKSLRTTASRIAALLDLVSDWEPTVRDLEELAPRMSWSRPNPEYPWVDGSGVLHRPARYFEAEVMKVARFGKRARVLVKKAASAVAGFGAVWTEVQQEVSEG